MDILDVLFPHVQRMGLEQGREFVVKACVARQDMQLVVDNY